MSGYAFGYLQREMALGRVTPAARRRPHPHNTRPRSFASMSASSARTLAPVPDSVRSRRTAVAFDVGVLQRISSMAR